MTKFNNLLLAAAMAAPSLAVPAATAQVGGIAVADLQAAVTGTRAWSTARTQLQATYKPQLDQAEARSKAIQAELIPLVQQFQAAQRAPGANAAALQPQYAAIQQRQQAGQAEISRITAPIERAQAYVAEQIQAKLPDAVQSVVRARNVSLLVRPEAALFAQPAADVTPAITTELDRLVPTVNTNVPANWQPGQQGQGGATAPAPAPATTGRRNSGGR